MSLEKFSEMRIEIRSIEMLQFQFIESSKMLLIITAGGPSVTPLMPPFILYALDKA